jgi:hypothetical protein
MAKAKAEVKAKAKPEVKAKAVAKAPVSEKREYKTAESAALQKVQWEKKGYTVTRKANVLYIKKG